MAVLSTPTLITDAQTALAQETYFIDANGTASPYVLTPQNIALITNVVLTPVNAAAAGANVLRASITSGSTTATIAYSDVTAQFLVTVEGAVS